MNPLQQRVERECLADGDDEFAVEHEGTFGQLRGRRRNFRKIPRQILAGFRGQRNRCVAAGQQTAEAVPFGFVLPDIAERNVFDGAGFHRRQTIRARPRHAALRFRGCLAERFLPECFAALALRPRLRFNASIRSITLLSSLGSAGASMVLPAAFRFTRAFSAVSYLSLNLSGSNFVDFESRMWAARSTMSLVT